MTSPARILIYGQDPVLLGTRQMVLEHSGFNVTVALQLQAVQDALAAQTFDVFILCHSLSLPNCEKALALTRSQHASKKNLILQTALSGCSGEEGDATLSAFVGPRTLIEMVGKLTAPQTAAV